MEVVKIEKINLVEAVYQQLREMILSGKVSEGTKLESENKLAESFSVSRVVIREALQKLRGEKLIVTRQGVGTYVANPSNFAPNTQSIELTEAAYMDFIHFREAVEYTAAALAKNAATEEDFDELDRYAAQLDQQLYKNDEVAEADFEFHYALVCCAHNVFLENATEGKPSAVGECLWRDERSAGSRKVYIGFSRGTEQADAETRREGCYPQL